MILGALLDVGVPLEVVQRAVDAVAPQAVRIHHEPVHRHGFAARRCHVDAPASDQVRTWADIRELLGAAALEPAVRDLSETVFGRLAMAEGVVHGIAAERVHFHEVGALDAIADVVGVCAGFVHLGGAEVVVSVIGVGSGSVTAEHGSLPVPPPAVLELLRGAPSSAGPPSAPATELCTPTGAALLTVLATSYGPQPPMVVEAVGVGAGARDPQGHANILRLVVGDGVATPGSSMTPADQEPVLFETNIDDLDPRVWPTVIEALLKAGASDAWLTPILMKKGRPAHTLSVLVGADQARAVRDVVFRQTSTLGVRERRVLKHELDRDVVVVHVDGHAVQVKRGWLEGELVNIQPEYERVVAAAESLGRPVTEVLRAATALGETHGAGA